MAIETQSGPGIRREAALSQLTAIRLQLAELGVKYLALFGSVARDEADKGSDVDVLVEFEGKTTFDSYMDTKLLLEDALGRDVDLVTVKAVTPRMRTRIERDIIVVP